MEGDGPDLAEILGPDAFSDRPLTVHDQIRHRLFADAAEEPEVPGAEPRILWVTSDRIGEVREWIIAATGRDPGTLLTWIRFFDRTTARGIVFALSAPSRAHEAELLVVGHPGMLPRGVIRAVCRWAFHVVGLARVVARVPTGEPHLSDLTRRAGFRFEGIARCGLGFSQDAQIWAMTPHDCRWLPRPQLAIPEHDTPPPASLQVH